MIVSNTSKGRRSPLTFVADPGEQRGAGLGEFLDGVDELVAVTLVEGDREREHAAFGEPDAAGDQVEIEEVTQCGVAPLSVFLRAVLRSCDVHREHRAQPGEL